MGLLAIWASDSHGLSVFGCVVCFSLASPVCACGEQSPSSGSPGSRSTVNGSRSTAGAPSSAPSRGSDAEGGAGTDNSPQNGESAPLPPRTSEQTQPGVLVSQTSGNEGRTRADAGTSAVLEDAAEGSLLPDDITLWIAGDSTVSNGNTPCPRGWGGEFQPLFDDRVRVVNGAAGGRSVRTWLYEVGDSFDETGECELERDALGQLLIQDRWQAALTGMAPGDYLLIQFGINDGDPSCNRHVGLEAFVESYGMMAEAAKQRGAQPVFITPASMIRCNGSTPVGSRGAFVPATIEAGQQFDVPVIDLHAQSVELYTQLEFCPIVGGDVSAETTGPVGDFFCDDHTHFDRPGAVRIAELMGAEIAGSGLSLAEYLR